MKNLNFDAIDGQGLIIAFAVVDPRQDNPERGDSEEAPIPEGDKDDISRESDLQENITSEPSPIDPDSPDYNDPDEPRIEEPEDDELLENPERQPYEAPDRNIGEDDETRPRRDGRDDDLLDDDRPEDPRTDPGRAEDTQIF